METNQQVLARVNDPCQLRQRRECECENSQTGQLDSQREDPPFKTGSNSCRRRTKTSGSVAGKSQLSSFILFASLIILINLCSFQVDPPLGVRNIEQPAVLVHPAEPIQTTTSHQLLSLSSVKFYLNYLDSCFQFARLMFTQPMRLNRRTTRYTMAEARMLGKMAKVWYIKKKIKKLSKKLKKHTIAVPVFTAIPIYEHSYYPQPHVTHVSHGGGHHAAAASSYVPAVAQLASAPAGPLVASAAATATGSQQQMTTSASNQQQMAYGMSTYPAAAARASGLYHHHPMSASSHRIINGYAPSPPLYVDDNGGLYGHYGNAYGRYDGGYHVW